MQTNTGHATPHASTTTLDGPAPVEATMHATGGVLATGPAGPGTTMAGPATYPERSVVALGGHDGATGPTGAPAPSAAPVVRPISPPPPARLCVPRHSPLSATPPGPLCDLPYRWLARVAMLGQPDETGAEWSTVLTLVDPLVPTGHMPLPLLVREPGTVTAEGRYVQVGTVASVYRAAGPAGEEICAAGLFDLTKPFVPGLVGELTRAAEHDAPMTVVPQLADLEYAPDTPGGGPRVLTGWRLTGLVLGTTRTWPGCYLLPDDGYVGVDLGGVRYPMRRHHDPAAWRLLREAFRAGTAGGAMDWQALAGTLAVLGGMTTTAVHNDIARRLVDSGDALTLGGLMVAMREAVEAVDADDVNRGGAR